MSEWEIERVREGEGDGEEEGRWQNEDHGGLSKKRHDGRALHRSQCLLCLLRPCVAKY